MEITSPRPPLADSSAVVRQRLLLTLLFLGVAGLHRIWDLRSYTGKTLARLTGRKQAYGYHYTEAFLSQVARAGGAESLTDARRNGRAISGIQKVEVLIALGLRPATSMGIANPSTARCSFPEG